MPFFQGQNVLFNTLFPFWFLKLPYKINLQITDNGTAYPKPQNHNFIRPRTCRITTRNQLTKTQHRYTIHHQTRTCTKPTHTETKLRRKPVTQIVANSNHQTNYNPFTNPHKNRILTTQIKFELNKPNTVWNGSRFKMKWYNPSRFFFFTVYI